MNREYRTDYNDFKQAQRIWLRRSAQSRFWMVVSFWVMPAMGLVLGAYLLRDMLVEQFSLNPLGAGGLFGLTYFCFHIVLWRPLQLRHLYKQMKDGRPPGEAVELELTAEELISRLPGKSEGRFRRAALQGYLEDDKLLLVIVGRKKFLILPKKFFTDTELQQVRDWLGPPVLKERT